MSGRINVTVLYNTPAHILRKVYRKTGHHFGESNELRVINLSVLPLHLNSPYAKMFSNSIYFLAHLPQVHILRNRGIDVDST